MLVLEGQNFTLAAPHLGKSENVVVEVETGKVVTEVNSPFKQNGQGFSQEIPQKQCAFISG